MPHRAFAPPDAAPARTARRPWRRRPSETSSGRPPREPSRFPARAWEGCSDGERTGGSARERRRRLRRWISVGPDQTTLKGRTTSPASVRSRGSRRWNTRGGRGSGESRRARRRPARERAARSTASPRAGRLRPRRRRTTARARSPPRGGRRRQDPRAAARHVRPAPAARAVPARGQRPDAQPDRRFSSRR